MGSTDNTMKKKNGCFNRTIVDNVTAPDGYRDININGETIRIQKYKTIPFNMSKDCRYDKKESDPGCAGCRHL